LQKLKIPYKSNSKHKNKSKMKARHSYLFVATLISGLASCSKKDTTTVIKPTVPASNPIAPGNISGFVRGTFTTGNTYTITGDLTIKPGDTLASQQGVTVIVKNDAQIFVQGTLNLVGTKSQPISFNSDNNQPGSWGGFYCDTTVASVTIKWTNVQNTGGPDPSGGTRGTVHVSSVVACNVDIEDSWFSNGQDDCLRLQTQNGGDIAPTHLTILRNTITSSGSTDGEAINIKGGCTGDVAYNVIYSQAGTGVKLETNATKPFPQTKINVYNNTMVSCGWRRGNAEPGRGVSIDLNAVGNVFNNLMVDNYHGLEIYPDADTIHTTYGYNLFYSSSDTFTDTTGGQHYVINIRQNFYPSIAKGVPQSSDLISNAIGNQDPKFISFDGKFYVKNGAPNPNDFHLGSGSAASGKGVSTFGSNGLVATGSSDIGAYTSDGKGNQH
jgi:hypothetical protein